MKEQDKITSLCLASLFAALIFIATFALKVPGPFGYLHLGDCMIFVAVLMMGSRRGAMAGGIGAALADLIGGYGIWVAPTLICKAVMALVMGTVIEHGPMFLQGRFRWTLGAVCGGLLQCAGYTAARAFFYGGSAALVSVSGLLFQTGSGIVLALAVSEALGKTAMRKHFFYQQKDCGIRGSMDQQAEKGGVEG